MAKPRGVARQEARSPRARRAREAPSAELPRGSSIDPRHVVVVAYDGVELVDISSVTTGLDAANRVGAHPRYRVRLASLGGRSVRCDSGLELRAQARLEDPVHDLDTLVVSGGLAHDAAADDARLVHYVRRLAANARRIASVCTGATVLAEAGLLD